MGKARTQAGAKRRVAMKRALRSKGIKVDSDATNKWLESKFRKVLNKSPPSYSQYKKTKKRKFKKRKTKYGESIRKFNGKDYIKKWRYAYENDAKNKKERLEKYGYLVKITETKGGWTIWTRQTPKSREYEKNIFK